MYSFLLPRQKKNITGIRDLFLIGRIADKFEIIDENGSSFCLTKKHNGDSHLAIFLYLG